VDVGKLRRVTATASQGAPAQTMSEAYVVRNQQGHYWGKKKRWVDGSKAKRVMFCKHQDEGFNLLVELSARDIDLRGEVIEVELNDRGIPQVEPSEHKLTDEDDLVSPAAGEESALADGEDSDGDEGETLSPEEPTAT
jgi:hypothetical protein